MSDEPRRLVNADVIRMLHDQIIANATRQSEPWVTVEITDAAKGEVRIETKVSAPYGCDLDELRIHATMVRRIAEGEHMANTARKTGDNGTA